MELRGGDGGSHGGCRNNHFFGVYPNNGGIFSRNGTGGGLAARNNSMWAVSYEDGTEPEITIESDSTLTYYDTRNGGVLRVNNAVVNYPSIQLAAQGLKGESWPRMLSVSTQILTSQKVQYVLLPFVKGDVVTNLYLCVSVASASTTLAKMGLYSTGGTRLALSADTGTSWNTTGVRTVALTAPYTVTTTGGLYVAILSDGGTPATLFRGSKQPDGHRDRKRRSPLVVTGGADRSSVAGDRQRRRGNRLLGGMVMTPTKLTADELVYHAQVLGRVRDAQAVMNSWAEHLSLKYKLGPQDTIDTDGHDRPHERDPRQGGHMSVWLTPAEIKAKPVTGPAWLAVQGAAKSAWGTANVADQNSVHDVNCLAGALYAVRVDDGAMRTKVGENCRSAIGTEKGGRTLALGRNLAAYCAAADTVDFRGPEFVAWVKSVLAEPLDGMTLRQCQEKRGNNWGAMATMSRIAAAVYLRDVPELARAVVVFQGWLGDRAKYAGFYWGGTDWQADPLKPVGINAKGTTKQGHPVDGCLPDDQRRAGGFKWPPPAENYVRGALGPMYVAAEILRNNGYARCLHMVGQRAQTRLRVLRAAVQRDVRRRRRLAAVPDPRRLPRHPVPRRLPQHEGQAVGLDSVHTRLDDDLLCPQDRD